MRASTTSDRDTASSMTWAKSEPGRVESMSRKTPSPAEVVAEVPLEPPGVARRSRPPVLMKIELMRARRLCRGTAHHERGVQVSHSRLLGSPAVGDGWEATAAAHPSTPSTGFASLVSDALPRFEIGAELGRGAWGIVLAATHRRLGRRVAIKVVAPDLGADEGMQARFLAEAQLLASLDHPHIVEIFDYVEYRDVCMLVMEQLAGPTLWSQFTGRGLRPPDSCAAVMAACAALHHAHDRHVLHRDVKPVNVLVSQDRVVKVIDFGLAEVIGGPNSYATRTGEIVGTPAYMAPEQVEGADLTPRTDVYSTGIMLYELLSGQLPFSEDGGPFEIMRRHVHADPVPLAVNAPRVPKALAEVTMSAIARAPDDRFATAEAFGVAVGRAATEAWGPGWDSEAEFSIFAPGPIHLTLSAGDGERRPTGPPVRAAVPGHVDGRIARALHAAYSAWRAAHLGDEGPAPEWDDLDDTLRVSNQAQADHIFVKLAALGCTVHPVYGREVERISFTQAEVEELAQLEHRRWCAERRTSGWTLGPTKDVATRVTPYLVDWDELSEAIRDYDRVLVRAIPDVLAAVGLEVRR